MKQPVERRLAAILAADVAGCSRLMGLDEAGTAQALREHHAAADPLIGGQQPAAPSGTGILARHWRLRSCARSMGSRSVARRCGCG
jgi:hypothetical protein